MHARGLWMGVAALLLLVLPAAPGSADVPLAFYVVPPCRLVDTRQTAEILNSQIETRFQVQGVCGIPVGAKAVAVNLTVVAPTAAGHLSLYATGSALPGTSSINFTPATAPVGNGAIVALGPASLVKDLTARAYVLDGGQVHVVLDVTGFFAAALLSPGVVHPGDTLDDTPYDPNDPDPEFVSPEAE